MVLVIALAHREEIEATHFRDRALARLSAMQVAWREKRWSPRNHRRLTKARVAFHEATSALNSAIWRHTRWYRAYLRARGGKPFIVWVPK